MNFVTKAISCSTPTTLPARPSGNCCIRAMATPIGDGDGMHLTDDVVVAFSFYNVGIPNTELLGKSWKKPNWIEKQKLIDDIHAIFEDDVGIQALFITEFGNMSPTVDELADGYTTIGVANGHVPSSTGTDKRKADTIRALGTQMATLDNLRHWIRGGDFNLEESVV